ncbi:MAG: hypothetical protein KGK05_04025 [Xanthomonadaceae bacterium]|nr:hypothetical protein [Xanthomonadaceae bacterium]
MSGIDGGTTLALSGSRAKPMLWLAGLMGIPLLFVAAALGRGHSPVHAATPDQANLIGSVVVGALVVLLLGLLLLMRNSSVRVDQGVLIIHTSVGTKRIPLANLRAHGVHLVNFSTHPELRPVIKLWGTGLPGFAGGWFKLRNGDKAVCVLLDRHGISYLRSDADNLTLLLSLAEPGKLRAMLER